MLIYLIDQSISIFFLKECLSWLFNPGLLFPKSNFSMLQAIKFQEGDHLESKGGFLCLQGVGHGHRRAGSNDPPLRYSSPPAWRVQSNTAFHFQWLCGTDGILLGTKVPQPSTIRTRLCHGALCSLADQKDGLSLLSFDLQITMSRAP